MRGILSKREAKDLKKLQGLIICKENKRIRKWVQPQSFPVYLKVEHDLGRWEVVPITQSPVVRIPGYGDHSLYEEFTKWYPKR